MPPARGLRLVLATRNAHKVEELRALLETTLADLDIGLVGLEHFPGAPEVVEHEVSFAGNALLKANAIARHTGLPALADDSGLCVDVLGGAPGIFSARSPARSSHAPARGSPACRKWYATASGSLVACAASVSPTW